MKSKLLKVIWENFGKIGAKIVNFTYEVCLKSKVHTAQNQEGMVENVWKNYSDIIASIETLLVTIHQSAYAVQVQGDQKVLPTKILKFY